MDLNFDKEKTLIFPLYLGEMPYVGQLFSTLEKTKLAYDKRKNNILELPHIFRNGEISENFKIFRPGTIITEYIPGNSPHLFINEGLITGGSIWSNCGCFQITCDSVVPLSISAGKNQFKHKYSGIQS